ncbi:TPA: hypothetical protein N0F65_004697 [Lagenidium giganteum]|uniref:Integrase catalytic domain-containing protein n=1 Tax=Lagenidium giganteum TaxID=4803 RepID=A0AAV2Z5S8_9STRA|nr:TPA: hypothetical protein N0F65_004697 [Lagenidium giganteum]
MYDFLAERFSCTKLADKGPRFTATHCNHALHWDYLWLGDGYGDASYVLVLKDSLSHFCELFATAAPTAMAAAECLLEWTKRYGHPAIIISAQGSHFRNQVLQLLCDRLKIYQLDRHEWPYLLPVMPFCLNHTPVASLANKAPIEVFTGLPASSNLDVVINKDSLIEPAEPRNIAVQVSKLRSSLEDMHKEVKDAKETLTSSRDGAPQGTSVQFDVGDYVLWSRIDKRLTPSKRLARWVGPFVVTEARSHSFIVKHLLNGSEHEVHG